ncbi:hypothetical protein [Bradyrhizobium sp.]
MAFEELPAEYEEFFKSGGELPASLASQQTPAPTATPTAAPAATPVATSAPQTAAPAAASVPASIPEAPVAPASNPYLERLLAEKDQQVNTLAEQMKALQDQIAKAQETPAPDPTIDPLGHMTHQMGKLQSQLDALLKAQSDMQTANQTQTQAQQFMANVGAQVKAFEATHTDYQKAYQHMVDVRSQDFKDMGYTDSQIRQAIGNEEMQITRQAMALGKNPAELVYNFAKRYGYQAEAPKAAPENKLATIQKGLEASQTLERGTPPNVGEITTDNITAASEADINKMVESNWEGLFGLRKGSIF